MRSSGRQHSHASILKLSDYYDLIYKIRNCKHKSNVQLIILILQITPSCSRRYSPSFKILTCRKWLMIYRIVKLNIFLDRFVWDAHHILVSSGRQNFDTFVKKEPWHINWLRSLSCCPERKSLSICLVEVYISYWIFFLLLVDCQSLLISLFDMVERFGIGWIWWMRAKYWRQICYGKGILYWAFQMWVTQAM